MKIVILFERIIRNKNFLKSINITTINKEYNNFIREMKLKKENTLEIQQIFLV